VKENTARQQTAESNEAEEKVKAEAAVNRLSGLLTRVCNDEPDPTIKLSALVDALGVVLVEFAHNGRGVLDLDQVVAYRDGVEEAISHSAARHALARIAKDPTTVGSMDGDPVKTIINVLRGKGVRASVHRVPPGLAAVLAAILGRGQED
jgi:hypothetical protein